MITFKVIRWRNLLSTGNAFTEVLLNANQNALIVGENGAGKSTILDALTFALFGKAFRRINKPLLVNSVNEKACEVQIEFNTNGKEYKIVRGIKPTVFEIYCNDIMINQDSASKDYQEHLEKFILKMNYKSFTQIVILGSASFTPFMQLSPADRRTVIEDLLDIQIFSVMNVVAKQKMQTAKELLEKNRLEVAGKEDKKVYIEKTISKLRENNEEKKTALHTLRSTRMQELADLQKIVADKETERDNLLTQASKQTTYKEKHTKLVSLASKIDTNLKRTQKDHNFFCDNDSCPTCRQSIDESFKSEELAKSKSRIIELEKGLDDISIQIDKTVDALSNLDRIIAKVNNIKNDISSLKSRQSSVVSHINDIEDQIAELQSSDDILSSNESELIQTKQELMLLHTERTELLEERKYIDVAINLLKDGGIKTKIIKQYLPVINKLINKYLAQMGFFVNFNINEQFEETIKSRYRDEFSYQNFSEGEKTRIDLALLFTWRAIAKMRNSVNTNLLVLDEVLDGSLDNNGTDEFLKIMWDMLGDTNTFVISHKQDQMIDKFQKIYRFEKVKNFSRLAS
jgi:DNA repair exonuclease SbcCD ATPase subunit